MENLIKLEVYYDRDAIRKDGNAVIYGSYKSRADIDGKTIRGIGGTPEDAARDLMSKAGKKETEFHIVNLNP